MRGALAGLLACVAAGAVAQPVAWAKDLPSALRAAQPDRIVLASFWREDCPWCEELERSTFGSAEFESFAEKLVAAKVHGEGDGAPWVAKYGVRGYPTLLFLTGRGEVVARIQGYVSSDALRKEWEAAERRAGRAQADVDSAQKLADRVAVAAARRNEQAVLEGLKALAATAPEARDARAEGYLAAGVFFEEEMRPEEARPWFQKALVEAESARFQAYARLGVVRTLLSAGRFAECVKHLEAALATGRLFKSHEELAVRLLKLARDKAGLPPP